MERSRTASAPSSALSATITYIDSLANDEDLTFTVNRPANPAMTTQTYPVPTPIEVGPTTIRVVFYAAAGGQGAVVGTAQTPAVVGKGGELRDEQGRPLGQFGGIGTIRDVIIPANQFVRVGETKPFVFRAEDDQGNIIAVSPGSFKIESGAQVEINAEGTMTGKAAGSPTVTVRVDFQSATETVRVDPESSDAVRTYSVRGNNLVYSPLTQRIYAGVSATDPNYGNQIVTIDPNRADVLASAAIGEEPGAIAIGADGRTIHVSLDNEFAIRQFDAQTGTAGLKFNLASGTTPLYGTDIAAHPTLPGTIVVSLARANRDHMDLAVFDNGVARPVRSPFPTQINNSPSNRVEWGEQPGVVYGLNIQNTLFGLQSFAVNAEGIAKTQNIGTFFDKFDADFAFRGGRIYGSNGLVLDPASPGTSSRLWSESVNAPFVVDATARRYYAAREVRGSLIIEIYDLDSRALIDSKKITAPGHWPKEMVVIGPGRLAMTTRSGPIMVVDLAKLPGRGG